MKQVRASFSNANPALPDRPGFLVFCDNQYGPHKCGNNQFIVFQLDGQDHFHLQCVVCNMSFCPKGGDCDKEAEAVKSN